jgi:hypothetical protein
MKLEIRGCEPIIIPDLLCSGMEGAFNGSTPYLNKVCARLRQRSYLQSKLPLKLMCLNRLRERVLELGGYRSYLEPLAGIGLSARLLSPRKAVLNDLDPGCFAVLKQNFGKAARSVDAFDSTFSAADLVFADFNDFTMKRFFGTYQKPLENFARTAQQFLIVNDCSPFYLSYGATSYGVYSKLLHQRLRTLTDYFEAVRPHYSRLGFSLVHVTYISQTSFLLLARSSARLIIEQVLPDAATASMVSVQDDAGVLF